MKKVTLILLTAFVLSCNTTEKKPKIQAIPGVTYIVAVYTETTGNKFIEVIAREIKVVPVFDTTIQDYDTKVDTQYYKPVYLPIKDSLGKPILDSLTHQPKTRKDFYQIGKDSINWHITNIPVSELLKK